MGSIAVDQRIVYALDRLSRETSDTAQKAEKVRVMIDLFPEANWVQALAEAACRQEDSKPGGTSMRELFHHMATELMDRLTK